MNTLIVIWGHGRDVENPSGEYPAECLVLHPDIHDACALLDATDQAGEGLPRKHIQGVGTYYSFSSVYMCPVYYVHVKGLEELV